ncbi:MAG TPA: TlyA family RNA methyltransferase [Coriobacteriia bacterium]|nr:TlyA family RNA methyltransferase [Coriobacteriia bacterium]
MVRRRADAALVERGLFPSREQARAAIMAGEVRVAGQPVRKAGQLIDSAAPLECVKRRRYVSRGGDKLASALDVFGLEVEGVRALDVGASTGGFTDCLLQRGARSVTALDVGYGQLSWSLRQDERVTVVERTNIREVEPGALGERFDLAVVDVSFVGLGKVVPNVVSQLVESGHLLALVKPQFEAGKDRVGKRGVVRDRAVHEQVLESVVEAVRASGLVVRGLTWSPLRGPAGNIEFWLWAAREGDAAPVAPRDVVAGAHVSLGE